MKTAKKFSQSATVSIAALLLILPTANVTFVSRAEAQGYSQATIKYYMDKLIEQSTKTTLKNCYSSMIQNEAQHNSTEQEIRSISLYCAKIMLVGLEMLRNETITVNNPVNANPSEYFEAFQKSNHMTLAIPFVKGMSTEQANKIGLNTGFKGVSKEIAFNLYTESVAQSAALYQQEQKMRTAQ
jgi:hypothetical protein